MIGAAIWGGGNGDGGERAFTGPTARPPGCPPPRPPSLCADWKWRTFARRLLLCELCSYFGWLAAFFVFAAAFQDEDSSMSLRQLASTLRGRVTLTCDALALTCMAPFLVTEARSSWLGGGGGGGKQTPPKRPSRRARARAGEGKAPG